MKNQKYFNTLSDTSTNDIELTKFVLLVIDTD